MAKGTTNKMNLVIIVLCSVTAIIGIYALLYAVNNKKPIYHTGSFYRAIGVTNNKYYLLDEDGNVLSDAYDYLSKEDLDAGSIEGKNYIRYKLGQEEGILDVLSGNPILKEIDNIQITDIGGEFYSLFTVKKVDKYGMVYFNPYENSSQTTIPLEYDCIADIGESNETIGIRDNKVYLLEPHDSNCELICTGNYSSCITLDAEEGFYAIYSADTNTFQIVHDAEILDQAEYLEVSREDDGTITAVNLQQQEVELVDNQLFVIE